MEPIVDVPVMVMVYCPGATLQGCLVPAQPAELKTSTRTRKTDARRLRRRPRIRKNSAKGARQDSKIWVGSEQFWDIWRVSEEETAELFEKETLAGAKAQVA